MVRMNSVKLNKTFCITLSIQVWFTCECSSHTKATLKRCYPYSGSWSNQSAAAAVYRAAMGWKVLLWHEAHTSGAFYENMQSLRVQFD